MKYKVSPEGVAALNKMSADILAASEKITTAAKALRGASDEHADLLGPHQSSLENVLEEIHAAETAAAEPVENVSQKLNDLAQKYEEIIADDPFASLSMGN